MGASGNVTFDLADACDLITVDGRLATATGPRCPIRILR